MTIEASSLQRAPSSTLLGPISQMAPITRCLAFVAALLSAQCEARRLQAVTARHVVLISVDGLHSSDLDYMISSNPTGAVAAMAASGVKYSKAYIQSNTDSFPGVLALTTGANPKTHGVYYDDSYDHSLWPPGTPCTGGKPVGPSGAEIVFDESIDVNMTQLYAGAGPGIQSIDPATLPLDANCKPVYPHQFNRANTIFEVAKAGGMQTAWADKHPAYDLLNGPSGKGIDQLYTPEINSADLGLPFTADSVTTPVYDTLHLQAIVHWIMGLAWDGSSVANWTAPAIMGGNFQTVSVAQKYSGYLPDGVTPTPALEAAFDFIEYAVETIMGAIDMAGLSKSTTVILTAKHGQSAKKQALLKLLPSDGDGSVPGLLESKGIKVAMASQDDVSIIYLANSTQTAAAAALLTANAAALGIQTVYSGASLQALGWVGNPATDSRAPDIVTLVQPGVIYVGKPKTSKKLAEHGGLNEDDRHVALLISKLGMKAKTVTDAVTTTQVAPSVLSLLGLSPSALMGVQKEGTKTLPGLTYPKP